MNSFIKAVGKVRLVFSARTSLWLVVGMSCQLMTISLTAVSVTISPAIVTNNYAGKITITVAGLSAGKTVRVEKFADLNTNGVLNAPDLVYLWSSFTVTDGQLPSLAGGTNLNVVGDMDATTNGQIRAEVFYPGTDQTLDNFAIKYLIRVSDTAGTFSLTNSFEVRQKVYPQGVTGKLVVAGTSTPVTNSVVVLINQNAPGGYGAAVDAGGNYTVYCPAGSYSFVSFSPGYNAGASVTVSSNVIKSLNLTSSVAPYALSGKITDSSSGAGLPGVFIQCNGANGFAGGFSDTNGNYSVSVTAGQWQIKPSQSGLARLGYIAFPNGITQTVAGAVSGLNFALPKGTALIYGRLTDNLGNPLPGNSLFADDGANTYEADGESYAADGSYAVAVKAGNWYIQPDNDNVGLTGYQVQGTNVTLANGQRQEVNLVAQYCGSVQITTTSLPDGQVGNYYDQLLNASSCSSSFTWSIISGSLPSGLTGDPSSGEIYGTPDTPGTNNFTVQVQDGNNNVTNRSYSIVITGVAAPLQVDTTFLPAGTNGAFYTQTMQASGGQPPYSWAIPGYSADPPPNVTLAPNGVLSGTLVTNGGPYYFDVQVTDGAAATAYQTLSLYVVNPPLPPLVITNVTLPTAAVGAAYTTQLGATGGLSPYSWSYAVGSATLTSVGLTLDSSGLISGTPTTNKTATFKAQVTDGNFNTTNKVLSITINAQPALSAPVWLTNRFQARLTGVIGQNYTVQYSTTLTNWNQLLITNSGTTNSLLITDPAATNKQRSYRVLVGP